LRTQSHRANRIRIVAVLALAALVVAPITGFAACARGLRFDESDAEQLRRFAQRMERAADLTYTAEYDAAGVAVSHTHQPPRQAYRTAAATLVVGPDTVLLCRLGTAPARPGQAAPARRCERAPGIDGITLPQARAVSPTIAAAQFVAPEVAIALILRAAGRPGLHLSGSRERIAEADADCATVSTGAGTVAATPASDGATAAPAGRDTSGGDRLPPLRFTACVTEAGVLARFDGTTDAGTPGRTTLQRLTMSTAPDAFEAPPGLALQDSAAVPGA